MTHKIEHNGYTFIVPGMQSHYTVETYIHNFAGLGTSLKITSNKPVISDPNNIDEDAIFGISLPVFEEEPDFEGDHVWYMTGWGFSWGEIKQIIEKNDKKFLADMCALKEQARRSKQREEERGKWPNGRS